MSRANVTMDSHFVGEFYLLIGLLLLGLICVHKLIVLHTMFTQSLLYIRIQLAGSAFYMFYICSLQFVAMPMYTLKVEVP